MKSRRGTNRSFPGRLGLEQWLMLPYLARRDLVSRATCELLKCERFCANKQCRRHRTCCSDDAMACEQRLWHLIQPKPKTLRCQAMRLADLAR